MRAFKVSWPQMSGVRSGLLPKFRDMLSVSVYQILLCA
jgi:hypothetical protein